MLIWQGYGILVPVMTIAICLIVQLGLDSIFYEGYYSSQKWTIAFALFLAAIVLWFLGKRLHKDSVRLLVDPKTGEEVKLVKKHSLFWIKVEYWGPILMVIGLATLIQ